MASESVVLVKPIVKQINEFETYINCLPVNRAPKWDCACKVENYDGPKYCRGCGRDRAISEVKARK